MTKQKLIEDNMNLVYALISKEYPTYIRDEDIIQCGMLGLCKAAEKYDESKSKFSTFAHLCIRSEIQMELRRRAKHQGILSLDYEVTNEYGETSSFGDVIVGDEDVYCVDVDTTKLTKLQQRIVEALKSGRSPREVSDLLGCGRQVVYTTMKILRRLRG